MRSVSTDHDTFLDTHADGIRAHLITITPRTGSVVYWTNYRADLVYGGHTFLHGGEGTTVPLITFGKREEAAGAEIGSLDVKLECGADATFAGVRLPKAAADRAFDGATVKVEQVVGASDIDLSLGTMPFFSGVVAEARPSSAMVELDVECGLAALNVEIPRRCYKPGCTNILGDAQCGLSLAALTVTGTAAGGGSVSSFGSDRTEADDYFNLGVLTFSASTTTVALQGASRSVVDYANASGTFTVDRPPSVAPAAGDTFSVYPGCDKQLATCHTKFGSDNRPRFRGVPYVPRDGYPSGARWVSGRGSLDLARREWPNSIPIEAPASDYEGPIPVVIGKTRITGKTIWRGFSLTTGAYQPVLQALCEGPIAGVVTVFTQNQALSPFPSTSTLLTGTRPTQSAWTAVTGDAAQIGYPGIACAGHWPALSVGQATPTYDYEVRGFLDATGGTDDADAMQAIKLALYNGGPLASASDGYWGAAFPFSVVTNAGLDESNPAPSSADRYCAQSQSYISIALTEQRQALDVLNEMCQTVNCEPLWRSDGTLKIVPRADVQVGTFTPCVSIRYAFGESDFAKKVDPVSVRLGPESEAFNSCPVVFRERTPTGALTDATMAYQNVTEADPDPVDVAIRGERPAPPVSLLGICRRDQAVRMSRILAQRQVRARQEIEFSVGWRFCRLEPLDLVTITDSLFPFSSQPFQIRKISEDCATGEITITAQEWTAGVNSATAHTTQSNEGATLQWGPDLTVPLLTGQAGELWPNGASEINGTDTVGPAWSHRYEAGVDAYAGTWVRHLSASSPSGVDSVASSPITVVPGHTYRLETQAKRVSGTGTIVVKLVAYAADGTTVVASAQSSNVTGTSYSRAYAELLVPSTAISLIGYLYVQAGAATNIEAYFDAITFIRTTVTPPTLTGSVSPATVSGECHRTSAGNCAATTTAATAAGGGGVPVYTYAWQYVSGDTATIDSPTAATTTFTRTAAASLAGHPYSGLFSCVVTDHDGNTVTTSNVTVNTTHWQDY